MSNVSENDGFNEIERPSVRVSLSMSFDCALQLDAEIEQSFVEEDEMTTFKVSHPLEASMLSVYLSTNASSLV